MSTRWIPIVLSALLYLSVGCQRSLDNKAKLRIQLPNSNKILRQPVTTKSLSSFSNSLSTSQAIGNWGVADPTSIGEIDCYGVLIESDPPVEAPAVCQSDSTLVAEPWKTAGLFNEGSVIELSVTPGAARKVIIFGMQMTSGSTCPQLPFTSFTDGSNLSAPFIVGSKLVDINPGKTEIDITVSLSSNNKFDSCTSFYQTQLDENTIALFTDDITVTEGQTAEITVALSQPATSNVLFTFNVLTANSKATPASDYIGSTFSGSIPIGGTLTSFWVPTYDDEKYEGQEWIQLSLSSITGAVPVDQFTFLNILDNESPPDLFVADTSTSEGFTAFVTVTMSRYSELPVSFFVQSNTGTAVASDFLPKSGIVTIAPNSLSSTISISTINDILQESDENFSLSVVSSVNSQISDGIGSITIWSNDVPMVNLVNKSIVETGAPVQIDWITDSIPNVPISIQYQTYDATAIAGQDYTARSGYVTVLAGQTLTSVQVPILTDSINELNETFGVQTLTLSSGYVGNSTASITIIDNDSPPVITVTNIMGEEGSTLNFVVSLSNPSSNSVAFNYSLSPLTASVSDYNTTSGSVSLSPNSTLSLISVQTTDDNIQEPNETFLVSLSNPVNATLATPNAIGTILANDAPQLGVSDVTNSESSSTFEFVVTLIHAPTNPITFIANTINGTAIAGTDYAGLSGLFTISSNQTSITIPVQIIDDAMYEDSQIFSISLSSLSDGTFFDSVGLGTIIDNDSAPGLFLEGLVTNEAAGTVNLQVTLSSLTENPLMLNLNFNLTTAGTSDFILPSYSVTLSGGSLMGLIPVSITNDFEIEPTESFQIQIVGASMGTIIQGSGAITVHDNDGWKQQAYFKASNPDDFDLFGQSVDLDIDTLIVGAEREDSGTTGVLNGTGSTLNNTYTDSGAAYIYKRNSSTWVQQAYLKAPKLQGAAYFGSSVSLYGDLAAVGMYRDDTISTGITMGTGAPTGTIQSDAGAVFIYRRTGQTWVQEAALYPPISTANNKFGYSLSLDQNTLIVSAPYEDGTFTSILNGNSAINTLTSVDSGAVYIFHRTAGTWASQAYIKASNSEPNDFFGWDVSIYGDTAIVGADMEGSGQTFISQGTVSSSDNAMTSAGAAYIFKRYGNTWIQNAYLKPNTPDSNDYFGNRVHIHGQTAVVSAIGEASSSTGIQNGVGGSGDNSFPNAGAVYVFKQLAGTWHQEAYIKPPVTSIGQKFGSSLSLWGDLLAVGSTDEASSSLNIINGGGASADTASTARGSGYVFRRQGVTWSQEAYLKASNGSTNDFYGNSIAVNGDSIVVGASKESRTICCVTNGAVAPTTASGTNSGAAYGYTASGPLMVIIRQGPDQIDPAGSTPVTFEVEFSREINSATFVASDIAQLGSATGVTWTITQNIANRRFIITGSGSNGSYIPDLPMGSVTGIDGSLNLSPLLGYDRQVDY